VRSLWAALACGTAFAAGQAAAEHPRKKVIYAGWGQPTPAYLKEHWREMEASTPFDGVVLGVTARAPNGKNCSCRSIWQNWRWDKAWFKESLRDLQSCEFRQFTDNFLRICVTPGKTGWFDDEAWAAVANSLGIMAWYAKESGCRGICLDPEHYGAPVFTFNPGAGRSFADTCAAVRRRGAQVMTEMTAEFPEITVLAFFLNSQLLAAADAADPDAALAVNRYGLLGAFEDGMISAMPAGATIVDAYEGAYYFDNPIDYLRHGNRMRNRTGPAVGLLSSENRPTYMNQVQTGFAFFLDRYVNEKGARYYIDGGGASRLHRLVVNLTAALQVTDEYVWTWEGGGKYPGGRPHRWWPVPRASTLPQWEEGIPGITDGIRLARCLSGTPADLERLIDARRTAGTLHNLAVNPGFEDDVIKETTGDKQPDWDGKAVAPGYSTWQDRKSKGTYSLDRGVGCASDRSLKADRVAYGSLIQTLKVQTGDIYAAEAQCLQKGAVACRLMLRWVAPDGAWTERSADRYIAIPPGQDGWTRVMGIATVPKHAGTLVVILQTRSPGGEGDTSWFDDLGIYRLLGDQ